MKPMSSVDDNLLALTDNASSAIMDWTTGKIVCGVRRDSDQRSFSGFSVDTSQITSPDVVVLKEAESVASWTSPWK
eukprot:CAMPEP_0118714804 /NCGR_PEP_ID=MMETSP0800-20121206/26436_1 /TAXON_ID=210618 ORGANISM="Striatella unipunctata, Strain CCMP2910" /NCGR_SAMPLE_ID=MMETSP0800 /ASSEMBLY_ACC=CAM_ASM_000638 /LENGTH=75 /DNA_ID=CAMNT_0006620729 /DNA_START=393 /DNA_END=620 /DNA_ORIENTATION=+